MSLNWQYIRRVVVKLFPLVVILAGVILPCDAASLMAKLVFVRGGDVWIMNTDGTDQKQITFVGDASLPRLSNGTIIYRRNDQVAYTRMWRTDTTGATPEAVPNTEGILEFDLDPSGQRVVFTYWNNFTLYTMNIDGSNKKPINTTSNMHQSCISWGRDGFIYLDQSYYGNAYSQMVFRIPEDGVNNPALVVPYISQYPGADGPSGRVAFLGGQPVAMLRTMNGDGTAQADVPNSPVGILGGIAYDYNAETVYFIYNNSVYRINTDGTGLVLLTENVQMYAFLGGHNGVDFGYVPAPAGGPGVTTVWLGLKNSDDQGTQFDLRAEVLKNGVVLATGNTACVTGLTRNANLAKQVTIPIEEFGSNFGSGDVLSLRLLTRIGTNPDGTKCSGPGGSHSNATGLRVYYSSTARPARLSTPLGYTPLADYFFKLSGTALVLDPAAPTGAAALSKDSTGVNFVGGNPWKEVGVWGMTVQ